jgi:hypothetical protein
MDHGELASCLRTWRDRSAPAEAGLPVSPRFADLREEHPVARHAAPGSTDANALALLGAVGLQSFA